MRSGGRAPVDMVRDLFLALDWSKWNPVWGYGLVVEVEGTRDGQRVRYTYRNEHPPHAEWGGSRAYYKRGHPALHRRADDRAGRGRGLRRAAAGTGAAR